MPISSNGTSFTIPSGLATGADTQMTTEVELPYINPSNGNMPNHVKFTLNGYTLQNKTFQPYIVVFTASEYAQYTALTAQSISALKSLTDSSGQKVPQALQLSNFYTQVKTVSFQNGHGIRYLVQIMESTVPINNQDLFYYFAGLTTDGKYYVSAILPINTTFLAASNNPSATVPPDGITFNADQFQTYLDTVSQKLNATTSDAFTPSLDTLDELIGSIQVNGN